MRTSYRMHYLNYVDYYNDYVIRDKEFKTKKELKEFIKKELNEKDKIKSIIKKEIKDLDINEYIK